MILSLSLHPAVAGNSYHAICYLPANRCVCSVVDQSNCFKVTEFVDMTSTEKKTKTVILGESFGAMLGIRLGQLR